MAVSADALTPDILANPGLLLELDPDGPEFRDPADRLLKRARTYPGYLREHVISSFEAKLRSVLEPFADESAPDVEQDPIDGIIRNWNWVAILAAEGGDFPTSITLVEELLTALRGHQSRLGRLHKGTPLHQLGWAHARAGNVQISQSYFTAAMVEDILRDPDGFLEGPAAQTLATVFEKGDEFFSGTVEAVNRVSTNEALVGIALQDPTLIAIADSMLVPLGQGSLKINLPFDRNLGLAIRNWQTSVPQTDSQAKGLTYEVLMAYLFRTLGPFDTRGRVGSIDTEHDLILRDESDDTRPLGEYVLVECKNWKGPVGASIIREFGQKVRAASCQSGILVAKAGITGVGSNSDASYTTRIAYHRDGIVLVVVDDNDIEDLLDRKLELAELLRTRYEGIRFDVTLN